MPGDDLVPGFEGVDADRLRLLAEVASLYYESNYTQSDIAELLGISRTSVSRLLSEARDVGIVHITVRRPNPHNINLSAQIKRYFPSIEEVLVVPAGSRGYPQVVEALGSAAARLLERKLYENIILGISWNTGVYQVVRAIRAAQQVKATVVQLTGSAGHANPIMDGPDLTRWLAQLLGGRYIYLAAPLVVESQAVRDALLTERSIADALALARQINIALVGIGTVFPPLSSLLQTGHISEGELREIIQRGGVGDILTTFYDINGDVLPIDLHHRTIGLSLDTLKDIDCVIGVGASKEKAPAILGALSGGYLNYLVTDDQAASAVIDILLNEGDELADE
ncbi:MAG: sugar-binding transcriptional regulator [Chloroflexi bacterium]|nr:sugar-binding transcriptional regulator [Chloroflexota bacterium]